MNVIADFKAATEDIPASWDVLADCIVKLSPEAGKHFVDYNKVETETTADLDSSAYGINANSLKATRPKELENDLACLFDLF